MKSIQLSVEVEIWTKNDKENSPLVSRKEVGTIDAGDGEKIETASTIPTGGIYLAREGGEWIAILSPLSLAKSVKEHIKTLATPPEDTTEGNDH